MDGATGPTGRVTISRRVEWDMAHRLGPRCTTKCKNLHGHRYVAVATLAAETTTELGMVLDFGDAIRAMKGFVDERLDHACVVDEGDSELLAFLEGAGDKHCRVDFPTTVENLCGWLAARFQEAFDALPEAAGRGVELVALRVFETPNCHADWTRLP
ncbi:MAG: 6-carboxytetrahydropterin synthase [Planctomycetota bacterium]|nr:6-carboxytetrahydropterin synthase [Planctomycetota bacterium]